MSHHNHKWATTTINEPPQPSVSHHTLQWAITTINEPAHPSMSYHNNQWATTTINEPLQPSKSHHSHQWATTPFKEPLQPSMSHHNNQWATKILHLVATTICDTPTVNFYKIFVKFANHFRKKQQKALLAWQDCIVLGVLKYILPF
jgi:hypothetical protein